MYTFLPGLAAGRPHSLPTLAHLLFGSFCGVIQNAENYYKCEFFSEWKLKWQINFYEFNYFIYLVFVSNDVRFSIRCLLVVCAQCKSICLYLYKPRVHVQSIIHVISLIDCTYIDFVRNYIKNHAITESFFLVWLLYCSSVVVYL